jgi:hypothetical protein
MMQTAGLAGDLFEFAIKPDRVTLQSRHIGVGVERMKTARGVPGGTRGQFRAFDQDDIFHTECGQVINDAAANNPATDDDNLRMTFHDCYPSTEKLLF